MNTVAALICIVACCGNAYCIDNSVGIYFDENAQSSCIQNIASYPYISSAYIILNNLSPPKAISGWEASVSADSTLTLVAGPIVAGGTNFSTFPNYQVGLVNPIYNDTLNVLASFTVIAMGPGSLYLSPAINPSVGNATSPLFIQYDNPGLLLAMQYEYGSVNQPVATIGSVDCPTENIQSIDDFVIDNSLASNIYMSPDNTISMKTVPGLITFPPNNVIASIDSVMIGSANLRNLLLGCGADSIAIRFPSFINNNLIRTTRTGETVQLIDMSNVYIVSFENKVMNNDIISSLTGEPGVEFAGYMPTITYDITPHDDLLYEQWGLRNTGQYGGEDGDDIRAVTAWNETTGDSDVIVGVVDDGIWSVHPDLTGRVIHRDATGLGTHGTGVASIIGANTDNYQGIAGVDWHCRLLDCYSGTDMVAATQYGVDHGADVLNHSYMLVDALGRPSFDPMYECAIRNAYRMNIVNVASMGNRHQIDDLAQYPASLDQVIAVGAIDRNGGVDEYSTRGPHIDVCAPGVSIIMCENKYGDYKYGNGTSYAAPHVAGIASLMLSKYPNLYNDDILNLIRYTARDWGNVVGFDDDTGYGLVDAESALTSIDPPYYLYHGQLTGGAQYVDTWGPYMIECIGFPDMALIASGVRAEWRMMSWTNIEIPVDFIPSTVKIWGRDAVTNGYTPFNIPLHYIDNKSFLSYYPDDNTVSISTFVLELWDTNTGQHFRYPETDSQLTVAFTLWGELGQATNIESTTSTNKTIQYLSIYPNPFNSSITISSKMREATNIDIMIYDIRGRLVYNMYSVSCNQGDNAICWDGRANDGRSLPSGKYTISIRSEEERATETVVLVK